MSKKTFFASPISVFVLLTAFMMFPFQSALAEDTDSIAITKDVILGYPIQNADELPDQISFSLYESKDALAPLAIQNFVRGEYAIDFDFSKSDGLSSGSVARLTVNFNNKLDLENAVETSGKPNEIWAELSIQDEVVGNREKISDESMVKLLLASDASIATYLTLAYAGDGNPITTIYRDLPIATSTSDTAAVSLSEFFSSIPSIVTPSDETRANNWTDSGANVYTTGNVGVGTASPTRDIRVEYSSASGGLDTLPTISVANTNTDGFSFSSFEFSAENGGVAGEFFADGSGQFLGGTPNVYFRASTDHPILLGTNKTVRMIITNTGNVGIGTTSPAYKLAVNGSIGCQELTVTTTGWPDFVFQDGYNLQTLDRVESYIAENKHLPGIPSAAVVKEKGVRVGDMSSKLLQKIEELTLYVIDLKKENASLKDEINTIQSQLDN